MAKATIPQGDRRIQDQRGQFFNKRWIDTRKALKKLISIDHSRDHRTIII